MLSPDQKGAIAESAIVHVATKLGVDAYKPCSEGGRYDVILDVEGRLLRVQCKWAVRHGAVVVIRCYSCRRSRTGMIKRVYTVDEIDVIAAYCADLDRCFLLPPELFDGRAHVQLRLSPALNNQRVGIKWAEEFDFAARIRRQQGAVAQLGERLAGSQ